MKANTKKFHSLCCNDDVYFDPEKVIEERVYLPTNRFSLVVKLPAKWGRCFSCKKTTIPVLK